MARTPSTRLRAIRLVLLVLTLTIFAGAVGVFTLESRRFLGAISAAVMLSLALGKGRPRFSWWFAVAAFLVLLWRARQPELWLLLTSGVVYLDARLAPDGESEAAGFCDAAAVGLFSALYLVSRQWPVAWVTLEKVAQQTSEWIGRLTGSGISYGATAGGWWILFAFLALGLALIAHAKSGAERARACGFCGYVAALYFIFLGWGEAMAFWVVRAAGDRFTRYPGSPHLFSEPAMVGLHASILFLTGGLIVTVLLLPTLQLQIQPNPASPWKLAVAAAFAIGLAAMWAGPMQRAKDSRVLIYGNGMLEWRAPVPGVLGIAQSGMFGLMPSYLEASGFHVERLQRAQRIDAKALRQTDVFMIINPTRYFSDQELADIWAFVRNGGGLLVIGDHTDLYGIMEPLNQVLDPVPIRFRFDSAFSIRHWVGDYEWFDHPITRRLDSSNDLLQEGTGASLALGPGAFPLVVGKYAFSDLGDRLNVLNAYLGDYRYETGELLSDVAFIAGAQYGAGRVMVFGDTTMFQNPAICRSAPFVSDVFTSLAIRPRHPWLRPVQQYLILAAAVAVLAGCFWGRALQQIGPVCCGLALGMWIGGLPQRRFEPAPFEKGRLAFVDTMHANRFSLEMWLPDSIGGLMMNLERDGFLPLTLRDMEIDQIMKGKVLVCIAPAKPYTKHELNVVQDFMEQGGLVILSVGYDEKEGARSLLSLVNCDIDSAPLGPVPIYPKSQDGPFIQHLMQQPHMMDAWPLIAAHGLDKTYYRSGDSDIIGFKHVGRGGMLVIADGKFLWDKTLEQETTGWPGNIKLLRQMLEELASRQ